MVSPRSKDKTQKECTGLITDSSSEMYHGDTYITQQCEVVCMRTGVQTGHDTMGRIISEDGVQSMMPKIMVEDGIQYMIPEEKLSARGRWRRKHLEYHGKDDTKKAAEEKYDAPKSSDQKRFERQESRCEREEKDKSAGTKIQAKAIMKHELQQQE